MGCMKPDNCGYLPLKTCTRSHAFRPAIRTALAHPAMRSQAALTNVPMRFGSLVKATSGKTAKLNCMLRTTWLSTSSLAVPLLP